MHAHLISQIQDLVQKIERGATTLTPPVLDFLEDWLFCHIGLEDRELAQHLKGVKPMAGCRRNPHPGPR